MNMNMLLKKGFRYLNRQGCHEGTPATIVNMNCDFSPFQSASGLRNAQMVFEKIESDKVIFHCYWYGSLGRMQIASIASLAATQISYEYEIWLWIDEAKKESNINNPWLNKLPKQVKIKYYNPEMVKDVPSFRKVFYLFDESQKLAFRADGFRMWALHEFGGFYFDLDIIFLRDMGKLIKGPEFVYAWEKQQYANNAILYLRKNSWINEYLARKIKRIHSTQPWALFNYGDKKLKNLKLLSTSTFDPIWGDDDPAYPIHSFQEFFSKPISLESIDNVFPFSYGYHWHNNWKAEIADNSLFARLESKNMKILGIKNGIIE